MLDAGREPAASTIPRNVACRVACSSLKLRSSSSRIRSSKGPADRHAAIHCFSWLVGMEVALAYGLLL